MSHNQSGNGQQKLILLDRNLLNSAHLRKENQGQVSFRTENGQYFKLHNSKRKPLRLFGTDILDRRLKCAPKFESSTPIISGRTVEIARDQAHGRGHS